MPYNTFAYLPLKIDGSSLSTGTATTAGLVIGQDVCVALDNGSNQVTITFNEALQAAPLIYSAYSETGNVLVQYVSSSTTTLVYNTVKSDDHTTGVADADVNLLLIIPISVEVR